MAYIGRPSIVGNFVKLDAITAVNGQAAYTMQNNSANFADYSTVNQFLVSLNGTIQSPGSSFTVSGSTLTFASNLSTGDVIDFIIVFGNSLSAGVPTDATVSTAKIVDANVTTAKLADDAVTAAKINDDIISGSTELASEPADTDEFLVSDAGTLKRIDYSLIKGTGTTTLIKTIDASTASTVEFIDGTSGVTLDSTFDTYLVRGSGIIVSATAGVVMRLRESGSFISSSDYDTVSYVARGTQTSLGADGSTSSSYIRGNWQRYSTTTAGFSINFEARLYNFSSTSLFKQVYYSGCNNGNDANDFSLSHGAGLLDRSSSRTAVCDGIQFLATSGTLTGKFSLYGVTT